MSLGPRWVDAEVVDQSRSPVTESARVPASWVPLLLFAYGTFRFIDRIGGSDRSGPWWVIGHVCFLGAILGIAALIVLLWRELDRSIVTDIADVAGVAGAAAFVWVILGDIFPAIDDAPDLVTALGPPAFLIGLFTLLGVAARRGQFPWPHWVLVVIGFGCVVASLDLLPLAAIVLLLGFEPLRTLRRLVGHRPSERVPR